MNENFNNNLTLHPVISTSGEIFYSRHLRFLPTIEMTAGKNL
jgi:hypothetical protein